MSADRQIECLASELARVRRRHTEAVEENLALREEVEDYRGGWRTASGACDRFRDVLTEALGHEDNPGDDVLISKLRAHFGHTGPESTRWRDFPVDTDDELAAYGMTIGGDPEVITRGEHRTGGGAG